jgi:hypothetical protein
LEIEVTSVTYHAKVGETIGQISPPYILLNQNVGCIFPSKICCVIKFETKWYRRIGDWNECFHKERERRIGELEISSS